MANYNGSLEADDCHIHSVRYCVRAVYTYFCQANAEDKSFSLYQIPFSLTALTSATFLSNYEIEKYGTCLGPTILLWFVAGLESTNPSKQKQDR